MLTLLSIQNFTTVDHLEIEFQQGFTAITGETGAGKSVFLDALGLAIGARCSNDILRNSEEKAQVTALFQLSSTHPLCQWLNDNDYADSYADSHDDNKDNKPQNIDIMLRRVIMPNGRSRAYINSNPVTISDLKYLGEQLVDLHSQHEHQSLLKRQNHQVLIDEFAQCKPLLNTVAESATQWHALEKKINTLKNTNDSQQAHIQLLSYQTEELEKLNPKACELPTLRQQQKQLANAEELLHQCQTASQLVDDEQSGALHTLQKALQAIQSQQDNLPALRNTADLLNNAIIQLEEASSELLDQSQSIEVNPEQLNAVEDRLDQLYTLARKHQCEPEALAQLHESLSLQLQALDNSDEALAALQAEQDALLQSYQANAEKLSKKRQKAAKQLSAAINKHLADLNMAHCQFEIAFNSNKHAQPSASGLENLEFLIATIPGKPPQSLAKVASGGELSRISLAIQVATALSSNSQTLVFDEVDAGIGGKVAEVVGHLLGTLGQSSQVLCVTHLAQVAAKGNNHLLVDKTLTENSATTQITPLQDKQRTLELARMIGGIEVTESTLAHASEMLETA